MKKIICLVLFLISVVQASNFGIGFMVGEPTAFCGKLFLNRTQALSFALGWSWYNHHYYHDYYDYTDDRCYNNRFYDDHYDYCENINYNSRYRHNNYHFHLDYLFHNKITPLLSLYAGPGLVLESFQYVGVRGDFGLDIVPSRIIDIFFELTPTVFIVDGPFLDIDGGIGVRFWF